MCYLCWNYFNRPMRHYFLSLLLTACVAASTGVAAEAMSSSSTLSTREVDDPDADNSTMFVEVEHMPQFPGGEWALMDYIARNVRCPNENTDGRVIVQFVVTKTGAIGKVKVVRSGGSELDREALRVVKTLPSFVPGEWHGQPVDVWYTLPIKFKSQH